MTPLAGTVFAVVRWGRRGVNIVEGAAKVAKRADGFVDDAVEESITIYRAVSNAELDDIAKNGMRP